MIIMKAGVRRHMYLDAWYIVPSNVIVFNWLIFLFHKEYNAVLPTPGSSYRSPMIKKQ